MSHIAIEPLVALIAGVLIFLMPRLLNYIVAVYLIAIGGLGLYGSMDSRVIAPARHHIETPVEPTP